MLFVLLSKRFPRMIVLAGFAFVVIHANLLDCYRRGAKILRDHLQENVDSMAFKDFFVKKRLMCRKDDPHWIDRLEEMDAAL